MSEVSLSVPSNACLGFLRDFHRHNSGIRKAAVDGTSCCSGVELQGFAFLELEFSVTWKQVALLGSPLEFEKAPSGTGLVTFLRALFKSDLLWFLVQGLLLGGVGSATLLLSDVFGVLAEARIRGAMVTQH